MSLKCIRQNASLLSQLLSEHIDMSTLSVSAGKTSCIEIVALKTYIVDVKGENLPLFLFRRKRAEVKRLVLYPSVNRSRNVLLLTGKRRDKSNSCKLSS